MYCRTLTTLLMLLAMTGCAHHSATPSGPAVEANEVRMPKSYRFEPEIIRVKAGESVTWRNEDYFTHSVSFTAGGFQLLDLPPGEQGSLTFEEPGEYEYLCTYHAQDMRGRLFVEAP